MKLDWNAVKKMTLWDYEDLINKILTVLSYNFIQEYYNHNMKEAGLYIQKLLGYNHKYEEYTSKMTNTFKKLDGLKVASYTDLVHKVENRGKCEEFLMETKFPFKDLISVLNHIFRWVLPHNLYLRELIEAEEQAHKKYIEELRKLNIRFNLDILERGRTIEGREKISEETRIPKAFVFDLVNRADMSRLPYSNRRTVKHLFAGGYDSVNKLACTDSEKLVEDMKSYFGRIGVKLSGFIDLKGITQWARAMPKIVEI